MVGIGKKVDDKSDQYYAYYRRPQTQGHRQDLGQERGAIPSTVWNTRMRLRDRNLVEMGNFRKPDALNIKNSWGLAGVPPYFGSCKGRGNCGSGDKSYAVDEQAMQSLLPR